MEVVEGAGEAAAADSAEDVEDVEVAEDASDPAAAAPAEDVVEIPREIIHSLVELTHVLPLPLTLIVALTLALTVSLSLARPSLIWISLPLSLVHSLSPCIHPVLLLPTGH